MLGRPDAEHHRFRLGLLFLVIGLILVLWAWGSWVYRASVPVEPQPIHRNSSRMPGFAVPRTALAFVATTARPARVLAQARPASPPDERRLELLSLTTMTVVLLLVMFLFGSLAVMVGGQRWRSLAYRKRARPTPNADVWAMHKLPDGTLEEPWPPSR